MPFLEVGGDRLHFFADGTGAPVIFVHGSCGGGGQWKALAGALKDDYRTLCIDMLGAGQSEAWPLEREWTLDVDARCVNAVLDHLGEPAHLVVHSGGGHFVYPTLQSRRTSILSLTMFEPVYFHLLAEAGDPLFEEPVGIANRYRSLVDGGDREAAMADFVDSWAGIAGAWQSLPERVQDSMRLGSGRLYHEWLSIYRKAPSLADLAALDIPLLLFKGQRTIPSMHRVCELIAGAVPECHYVEIDNAGHMAPFTHAQQALPAIAGHLAHAGALR